MARENARDREVGKRIQMKKCEQPCFFEETESRGRYVITQANGKVNQAQASSFEEGDREVTNCSCYCSKGYHLKIRLKTLATMPNDEKTVHFVRHCQSTWNEAQNVFKIPRKDLHSEAYLDCPLSALGEEQVTTLQPKVKALNAEIAITSPFTRAIQTCLGSYGSQNVVVSHWCGERGESLCDIGNTRDSLERMYPTLDFSELPPNVWWYVDENLRDQLTDQRKCYEWLLNNGTFLMGETDDYFQQRLKRFHAFLRSRNETNILVFSHSMFLRSFLNKYYERPVTQYLPNGSITTYKLQKSQRNESTFFIIAPLNRIINFVLSLLGIYFLHAYLLTKLTVYCEKNISDALSCTLCAPLLFLNFEYQL